MKIKSSILSLAATAAFVSSASAVTIDIVGSTAGRTAVYNQVLAIITETSSAASGATLTGSNQAIIHGTFGAVPVIVRLNFTGSAAGVNQVANRATIQVPFFAETVGLSGNTVSVPFSGGNIANSAAEIGYSDVFQTTTAFRVPALAVEDEIAVIPFQFFRHSDGNTSLTNVTSQLARAIYGGAGSVPLSLATGNVADAAKTIYGTGRDALSGTRITTFAEVATSQVAVSQYQPITSATNGTGIVTALGATSTGGFTSGSFVANVLNSTFGDGTSGNADTIIGYLGASDWPAQVAGNAVALNFNGVPYSVANLQNGSYTFWGYLHQFNNGFAGFSAGDATAVGNFYSSLRDALVANPGSGVQPISIMAVFRDGDGAPVGPNLE
ncbi:MAG: hypothetical protein HC845_07115 [Akkermansiaceae bacterium]|nr:hypothetical protein [Akkermansiaceae bacterium]